MTAAETLVEVRLLRLPVALHLQATEHNDELLRELALLEAQDRDPASPDVPARLRALISQIRSHYAGFTDRPRAEIEAAAEGGHAAVDVVYRVPPSVGEAVDRLEGLLDEADEFCRRGDTLLTLATPPRPLAYRRWFLEEFRRQLRGEPPRPWPG